MLGKHIKHDPLVSGDLANPLDGWNLVLRPVRKFGADKMAIVINTISRSRIHMIINDVAAKGFTLNEQLVDDAGRQFDFHNDIIEQV